MKPYFYCLFIIMICQGVKSVSAQVQNPDSTRDSLNETIIYEYDTVYVAPDTIRMTDTVVNYLPSPVKPSMNTRSHWAIAVNYSPYISNFIEHVSPSDSFSVSKTINHETDIQCQYRFHKYLLSFALGYSFLQERIDYKYDHLTTSENVSGIYDSLLIKSSGSIHNNYEYINLTVDLGRIWQRDNFNFFCNLRIKAAFLMMNNSMLPDNYIKRTELQKTAYLGSIQAGVAYSLTKNIQWQLSPFFQYCFSEAQRYPLGNRQVIGLSTGLIFIL